MRRGALCDVSCVSCQVSEKSDDLAELTDPSHSYILALNQATHTSLLVAPRVSDEANDFVGQLLVVDPSQRVTAASAMHHPWIQRAIGNLAPLPAEEAAGAIFDPEPMKLVRQNGVSKP